MTTPPPSPPPSSRPSSSRPPPPLPSSSSPSPSPPSDSTLQSSSAPLQPPEIVEATTLQHLVLPPIKKKVPWPPETVQLTTPAIHGTSFLPTAAQEQSIKASETEQIIPMRRLQLPLPKDGAPMPPASMGKNEACSSLPVMRASTMQSITPPEIVEATTLQHLVLPPIKKKMLRPPKTVQLTPPAIRGTSSPPTAAQEQSITAETEQVIPMRRLQLPLPKDGAPRPPASMNEACSSSPPAMRASTIQSISPPPKVFKYGPQLPPLPMVPPTFPSTGLYKDLPPPKYEKYKLYFPPPLSSPPSPPPPPPSNKLVLPPPQNTSPTTSPLPHDQSTSPTTSPLPHDHEVMLILPQELRTFIFSLMTTYKWYSIRLILTQIVDFFLDFIFKRMREDDDDAGDDFDL